MGVTVWPHPPPTPRLGPPHPSLLCYHLCLIVAVWTSFFFFLDGGVGGCGWGVVLFSVVLVWNCFWDCVQRQSSVAVCFVCVLFPCSMDMYGYIIWLCSVWLCSVTVFCVAALCGCVLCVLFPVFCDCVLFSVFYDCVLCGWIMWLCFEYLYSLVVLWNSFMYGCVLRLSSVVISVRLCSLSLPSVCLCFMLIISL